MKGNRYGFYIALGAMVLFALVAVTGIIIYFAKAAGFPVYVSLISAGVAGVAVSFALTLFFIPKNKTDGGDNSADGKKE